MLFQNKLFVNSAVFIILLIDGQQMFKSPVRQITRHGYNRKFSFAPIIKPSLITTVSHLSSLSQTQPVMNDIQEAFRFIQSNQTNSIRLIRSMFNLTNLNPRYIFQLPDKNGGNKKIIMRRSDFENPNYPNLTWAYIQLSHLAKRRSLHQGNSNKLDINHDEYEIDSKWVDKLHYFQDDFSDDNDDDDVIEDGFSDDALLENVVTETNFLNYVTNLNAKGEQYLKYKKATDAVRETTKIKEYKKAAQRKGIPKIKTVSLPTARNKDWERLGLKGWQGKLSIPEYIKTSTRNSKPIALQEIQIYDSNKKPNDIFEVQFPKQYNFFDNENKNEIWDLPGKVSSAAPLRQIIEKYNDETIKNMSTLLTNNYFKPKWPITKRREAHKDNDVYIARANDPFGHSTKWQLKNISTTIDSRRKRSVLDLYSMIKCSTGCDPLIFKGYGCYCGFMGSGVPVDGIDRCCKMHDKCYGYSNCPSYLEYFVPFLWKCYRGKPLCAIDHGEWGECADRLCQCDLKLSRCLRKFNCPKRRAICRTSAIRTLQNFLMIL